jgi:hypothetical protein
LFVAVLKNFFILKLDPIEHMFYRTFVRRAKESRAGAADLPGETIKNNLRN